MSRKRLDRELAALERLLSLAENARENSHQQALDAMRLHELERRRFDDLLKQVMTLKLAGAEPPAQPLPMQSPDAVAIAISRKAGANRVLRQHYAQEVHRMRAQKLTDEDIIAKIEAGDDAAQNGIPG